MTAREQEQAQEAARRLQQDVQDRVIEAIGELFARRASRKAMGFDNLIDLRITTSDICDLGEIAAMFAENDDDMEGLEAAFVAASEVDLAATTVAQLAAEITRRLQPLPATVAP